MRFLIRPFLSREAKFVLALLDEIQRSHQLAAPACDAFLIVREQVERAIYANPRGLSGLERLGVSTEQWTWSAIANISGDFVESGRFHLHRGMLNPLGPGEALLNLHDAELEQLVCLGAVPLDKAVQQKSALRENIRDVG